MSPLICSVSDRKDEDGSPESAGILTHLEEAISLIELQWTGFWHYLMEMPVEIPTISFSQDRLLSYW
jgi:hypothetical protein